MNKSNPIENYIQEIEQLKQENSYLKTQFQEKSNQENLMKLFSDCKEIAVLVTDQENDCIYCNAGCLELFEIDLKHKTKFDKEFSEMIFPEDLHYLISSRKDTVKNIEEHAENVVRLKTKSGKFKVIYIKDKFQYNSDKSYLILSNFTEISTNENSIISEKNQEIINEIKKRTKIEQALKKSETKLRKFIDQSPNGMFFINSFGNVIEWNDSAYKLTRIRKEDISKLFIWDFVYMLEILKFINAGEYSEISNEIQLFIQNKSIHNEIYIKTIKLKIDSNSAQYIELKIYPVNIGDEIFFGGILRDITSEKKTEIEFEKYQEHLEDVLKERTLELINSEQRIKNLSDSLPGGAIFRLKRSEETLKLDYVSRNFYELLGLNPNIDFNDINFIFENIHPDDLENFYTQRKIANENKTDFSIEARYFMPDKSIKWFQLRAKANITEKEHMYWDGYIIDTTEKNIYHSELIEREALLNSVIQNIPYDFWASDENGNYFIQNEASKNYWGNLLNKKLNDTNIPPITKKIFKRILEQVKMGKVINEENKIEDIQNSEYFFQSIAGPLIIKNQIKGALGFNIDITARKNVEMKLVQNEDKFRNIFNNSTDGVIIHSSEGVIFESNSTFKRLINIDSNADIIDSIYSFFDDESVVVLKKGIETLTYEGQDFTTESTLIRNDNDHIPTEIKSKYIQYLGKEAILTIIRDVSYRKKFERKLLNAIIETEEKERAKLAADLHDEIGPLLSSMKMYISLLQKSKSLDKSKYVGEQVFSLVTEAITSVREISNSLSPHVLTNYGLIEAVKNVIQSASKFISIQFDSNCESTRFSSNVETVYYRIFKELLNNTLKYAQASKVEISFNSDGEILTFTYQDNGVGFDYEKALENKKDGMGLFNIINRAKTIDAHYKYNSTPGEGTYFEMSTKIIKL